ncbi:hypothetical protein REPUB_Repub11eG0138800 [Reevesia pubescens]
MEKNSELSARTLNSNNGGEPKREEEKPKLVVIMGSTGSGKSRLAIDLSTHFPIEIINADSMQVYQGLDVLTSVPHHLLGTISSNVEFTAKKFRDSAIPIISDILSCNCLLVIVGGTNYYIQALVSSFLLDDSAEDMNEIYSSDLPGNEQTDHWPDFQGNSCTYSHDLLKELDPVAANIIHPNNHRKVGTEFSCILYLLICMDNSAIIICLSCYGAGLINTLVCMLVLVFFPANFIRERLQRVDCMIDAGLLDEVHDIYNSNANYTLGKSDKCWAMQMVGPAVKIIRSFLNEDRKECTLDGENITIMNTIQRDLWTQYICKVSYGCNEISLPAEIGYLEEHMSGNNINRAMGIENEYRGSGSLKVSLLSRARRKTS